MQMTLTLVVIVVTTTYLVSASDMASTVETLAKQLMMQQLFVEERTRSDGGSGIKQIRHNIGGSKTYHSETHSGVTAAAMHDHPNHIDTVGMGEFVAVLNGVEFRTRHNDYKLVMPHRNSQTFHATEEIQFPDVPDEVVKKGKIDDQIEEMKEWFRAFKEQDYSVRDYRKYFKPVLCYLEGSWTTDVETLAEPYDSDRNTLEASSWEDLHEKIRFTSYGGSKSNLENLAYLPTTVINVTDGVPILAQWNYRILCHQLENDLPLEHLRVVDDISSRMMYRRTMDEHVAHKASRFQVLPFFDIEEQKEGKIKYELLDRLMSEVPGVNNYDAELHDKTFGLLAYEYQGDDVDSDVVLNSAYYHRWYQVNEKGAQGLKVRHRGFSDPSVFMAQADDPHIAETGYLHCTGHNKNYACSEFTQRWTYAIPLEIIYLTPLASWNPCNIEYKGSHLSPEGATVNANGRNGLQDKSQAFDGSCDNKFYHTPAELFSSTDISDPVVGVLDKDGEMRKVASSGIRTLLDIEGVGTIRQRYPIFPVHGEYSSCWKEVNALKDIVLAPNTFKDMFYEQKIETASDTVEPSSEGDFDITWGMTEDEPVFIEPAPMVLELPVNGRETGVYPKHTHTIELNTRQVTLLCNGEHVTVTTSKTLDHSHKVELVYAGIGPRAKLVVETCDGEVYCEHSAQVNILEGALPPKKEDTAEELLEMLAEVL